jgi:hypothetical protein
MAGAKPPSSPTLVARPLCLRIAFRWWNTSTPARRASSNRSKPIGAIMNSWMSRALSACAPPFTMFMSGTGRVRAPTPPR